VLSAGDQHFSIGANVPNLRVQAHIHPSTNMRVAYSHHQPGSITPDGA
jgi:hypothetical protein